MKKTFLIPAIAIFTLVMFSCKKENVSDPAVTLNGTEWTGNYGYHHGAQTDYFKFQFKSSDSVIVYSTNAANPYIGRGLWTISGDSIRATFTYDVLLQVYKFAAKYPGSSTQMLGVWTDPTDAANWGDFTLIKQ